MHFIINTLRNKSTLYALDFIIKYNSSIYSKVM